MSSLQQSLEQSAKDLMPDYARNVTTERVVVA